MKNTNNIPDEAAVVKANLEEIYNEIAHLVIHQETLERLIEICRKKFESQIVIPKITKNLGKIGDQDLTVDLAPVANLPEDKLRARYDFFHYSDEYVEITNRIDALKNLYKEYQEHLKQYYNRMAEKVTDEIIYDLLQKVYALKPVMTPQELETIAGIHKDLTVRLAGDKQMRLELRDTLRNIILQHPKA